MGLGFGVVKEMQKAYKQNRDLGKRRKGFKDQKNDFPSSKESQPLTYNKMSQEEYASFQSQLKKKKKREHQLFFVAILIGGVIAYYILF